MTKHAIYWWNVENLFDVHHSTQRPSYLQSRIGKDLAGWDANLLDRKLTNLTSVIAQMNHHTGPDILGVCEIENEHVMNLLLARMNAATGRPYALLHKDTKDQRGIDIAFVYDQNKYQPEGKLYSLEVMKRSATRDLVQAQLVTSSGNKLVLVGNHWPSRTGGQMESEPFRIMVAETLAYWVERIHQEIPDANIVLMGDFNDNPADRSITQYLMASNHMAQVKAATNHRFYNLMHRFADAQRASYVYGAELNMLDQFMVSKSLITRGRPFEVASVDILSFPGMTAGRYNTPVRFGLPKGNVAKNVNTSGFSDHLPIELILKEK
jgi:predicted extracellular nuclease